MWALYVALLSSIRNENDLLVEIRSIGYSVAPTQLIDSVHLFSDAFGGKFFKVTIKNEAKNKHYLNQINTKQTATDWVTAESPPDALSSSSAAKRLNTPFGGALEFGDRLIVLGFCAISGLRAGLCVLLNRVCDPSMQCVCSLHFHNVAFILVCLCGGALWFIELILFFSVEQHSIQLFPCVKFWCALHFENIDN